MMLHLGQTLLTIGAMPAIKAPPADSTRSRQGERGCPQDFKANGALAGDHLGIIKGGMKL